ncbi:TPA: acyltransferase [Klebsiella quasipneumoniae subsp. similipneumoniae]|nr:acyltransferase [Klebsiella quasipneumoniae subsp. similipneumoniae]
MSSKKSIIGIQYLRGYAAILVVITHFFNNGGYISDSLNLKLIGEFGVDIFFIISGFIMAYTLPEFDHSNNRREAISFIKKRILRIYPIYLLILTPILVIYIIKVAIGKTDLSISSIFGSIFLLPGFTNDDRYRMINPPAWTLVYEMFFYVTLTITIFFSKNKKTSILFYSFLILLVLIVVNFFNFQGEKMGWVNLTYMIGDPIFIDFVMGFLLFYMLKIKIKANIKLSFMLLLCIFITFIATSLSLAGIPRLMCYGIPAFILVSIFTLSDTISSSKNKMLAFIGGASYSIYLSHPLFFPFHSIIHEKFGGLLNTNIVDLLFSILAVCFGCIVFNKIEKRISLFIKENC